MTAWPPPGYPPFGHGQNALPAFDRDMSGYLIGDVVSVPALAGVAGSGVPRTQLKLLGMPDHILRWKAMLACSIPAGTVIPANAALGLRFHLSGSMGNELIPRRCFVRGGVATVAAPQIVGNAQTMYVPGRSFRVEVENPTNVPINAHYGVDGGTAGFSYWSDFQEVTATNPADVELDIPAFCRTITVFGLGTAAAPELRGFNLAGTLVFQEVLPVSNSGAIEIDPHLRYTLRPSVGGPVTYSVLFTCLG